MLIDELRSTFLFQKLSDEQLRELVRLGAETTFPTGETIFVEGEPAEAERDFQRVPYTLPFQKRGTDTIKMGRIWRPKART